MCCKMLVMLQPRPAPRGDLACAVCPASCRLSLHTPPTPAGIQMRPAHKRPAEQQAGERSWLAKHCLHTQSCDTATLTH